MNLMGQKYRRNLRRPTAKTIVGNQTIYLIFTDDLVDGTLFLPNRAKDFWNLPSHIPNHIACTIADIVRWQFEGEQIGIFFFEQPQGASVGGNDDPCALSPQLIYDGHTARSMSESPIKWGDKNRF